MPFHRIFVPTADVVCHSFLLGGMVRNKVHCLAVGSRGCGKTSCIRRAVLDDLPDSVYTTMTITFSSQTSSNDAQAVRNKGAIPLCLLRVDIFLIYRIPDPRILDPSVIFLPYGAAL